MGLLHLLVHLPMPSVVSLPLMLNWPHARTTAQYVCLTSSVHQRNSFWEVNGSKCVHIWLLQWLPHIHVVMSYKEHFYFCNTTLHVKWCRNIRRKWVVGWDMMGVHAGQLTESSCPLFACPSVSWSLYYRSWRRCKVCRLASKEEPSCIRQ